MTNTTATTTDATSPPPEQPEIDTLTGPVTICADALATALRRARGFISTNDMFPVLQAVELRTTDDLRTLAVVATDQWKVAWARILLPEPAAAPLRVRLINDDLEALLASVAWPDVNDPEEMSETEWERLQVAYPDEPVTLTVVAAAGADDRSERLPMTHTLTVTTPGTLRSYAAFDRPEILDYLHDWARQALSTHRWHGSPGISFNSDVFTSLAALPLGETVVTTALTAEDGTPFLRFSIGDDFIGCARSTSIGSDTEPPRTWWQDVPDREGWAGVFNGLATSTPAGEIT